MAWTIIRAAAFREVWVDLLNTTSGSSGRPVVFGRGDNPINFVSVTTVAATVKRAILDPKSRGETLEITGPETLTLNHLAARVQADNGRSRPPRHIPRPVLHVMANTIGRIRPQLDRQADAALAMDQANSPVHRLRP